MQATQDAIRRTQEAIEAIRRGEMIIVMDDESRENEGDLVFAGIFSTPEKINFMAQEARGLICVAITQEIANQFDLKPMVEHNSSNHETAFTVSIDAKEAKTGISAFERDLTINLMCQETTSANDFVRPGHIFPLIAKEGGTLVRSGHTEAGVDICRLAGVKPVSVICEIMKKDGSMAHRGDKFLLDFAEKHHLKILYVSDLITYRLQFENLITTQEKLECIFLNTPCQKQVFKDHLGNTHYSFAFRTDLLTSGSNQVKPLVKFHAIRSDLELLENSQDFESLMRAIAKLKDEGGYLVFLNTKNYKDKDKREEEQKDFGIGAQILKTLGVDDFRLLSTTKDTEYIGLSGFNLNLLSKVEI